MTPTSAFAARVATDDRFRDLVRESPRAALAEYGIEDEPGLVPNTVELPSSQELAALGFDARPAPKPTPKPPPPPPTPDVPVSAQLFDPD